MELLGWMAPVISNEVTIYAVCGALLAWALVSAVFLVVRTWRFKAAVHRFNRCLDRYADAGAFAEHFERASAELERQRFLAEAWRQFRQTLVLPRRPGEPIRATQRPAEWFNVGLLRGPGLGVDLRYHAAMPNLLVGAGLLFTFLGLAVALAGAKDIVTGETLARNEALRTLLATASFKFITSLVGMLLSILYALVRNLHLHLVERALDGLQASIEKLMPVVTPLALQQEQLALLERQTNQLETFSNDLAVSIGGTIDQTFNERLAEHIGPLTEAIQRLSAGMGSRNEEALREMMAAFLSQLEGQAGGRMDEVARALAGLVGGLERLQTGLDAASERMARAADEMAARMGGQAEATAERLNTQLAAMVAELRALAATSRVAGNQAIEELAGRISAAAGAFESAAQRIGEGLSEVAIGTRTTFDKGAEAMVERMVAATEGMREEMRRVLDELRRSVAEAGEALVGGGDKAAKNIQVTLDGASQALAAALSDAADRLASAGGEAGSALQRGGEGAAGLLERAGGDFGNRADALARSYGRLAEAAGGLAQRVAELEHAVGEAAAPLRASAADLEAASRSARGLMEPLAQATQGIARGVDQMAGTAQRLEGAAGSASKLAGSLDGATQRFAGVDRDLAGTLQELQRGLKGFTQQIATFVGETDRDLAKATTRLGGLVKDLGDTLDDFKPN